MKSTALLIFYSCFFVNTVYGQSFASDAKIDSKELKCLVCKKSIDELNKAISKLDPNKKVDVGGYRLDIDGNYKHREVSQAKSELVLSEIIEGICDKMDNYVRALWKSNGTLTLLSMVSDDGMMNPNWSDVDIVQDDDLNKSLKFYCEEIMEEHEESIIKLYQGEESAVSGPFCTEHLGICSKRKKNVEL